MMADNEQTADPGPVAEPLSVGGQLRAAREALGMSVDDVVRETRISSRHIDSIEEGRFEDLPGRMYAIGFAKTYAKLVGLDQEDVGAMVRADMGENTTPPRDPLSNFEPGDPTRAPGRKLIWFSLFGLAMLLAGLFAFSRELFAPAAQMPSLIEQEQAEREAAEALRRAAAAEAAEQIDATGAVVFTAEGTAWVRFTDAQGRILMEKEMAEGDSFTVPADADGPKLITGRPDLLAITIDGRAVPKVSQEPETVVDIPVSGGALLARGQLPQTDNITPIAGE